MPSELSAVDRANLAGLANRERVPITIAEASTLLAMMAQDLLDVDERRALVEAAADALVAAETTKCPHYGGTNVLCDECSDAASDAIETAIAAYRSARQ